MRRLLWFAAEQLLALPTALFTNWHYLRAEPDPEALPAGDWVFEEATALLDQSEGRLQSLEGKGAGLATVCGIVAAAIAVAISLDWPHASTWAKVLLVAAATYSAMSLWAPIKLVGPVARATVSADTLHSAAGEDEPQAALANVKARAAAPQ